MGQERSPIRSVSQSGCEELPRLSQPQGPQKCAIVRLLRIRSGEELVAEEDRVSARIGNKGLGLHVSECGSAGAQSDSGPGKGDSSGSN